MPTRPMSSSRLSSSPPTTSGTTITEPVTADLHVHRYGPAGPLRMLAIHGLTGYGGRWRNLAGYLPEIAVAAPDLLGHGRSSWAAPWTIDANVSALAALLDDEADAPALVVGHSFGGALGMHLA